MNRKFSTLHFAVLSAVIILLLIGLSACAKSEDESAEKPARPSNSGGPGTAVGLAGDANKGAALFKTNCASCHGDQGKSGVPNPGSKDGSVPGLNPIDPTMVSDDQKEFATNIDLFVEHGSTPEGDKPALKMQSFGDQKILAPQDIADVIAYVISLNKK
jgi:mono/diheme cytochrome c family protein